MYKKSGRKLFLATNSLWDYTNVVMNYLIRCGPLHPSDIKAMCSVSVAQERQAA
jgi:hypothetical protein